MSNFTTKPNSATDNDSLDEGATNNEAAQTKSNDVVEKRLQALTKLSDVEYLQARKELSQLLGFTIAEVDQLVKKRREQPKKSSEETFEMVVPYPHPVVLRDLLDEISHSISAHVICLKEAAQAAALWIAMTWTLKAFDTCPIALITAPESRCGKSVLLSVLGQLANRPLNTANMTPATLFRSIDQWQPTFLIDEADAFLKQNEEMRGLINSGHTRDSAYVLRCVGDDYTPKRFSTWGPKAIAGIGRQHGTIEDRSIILELKRKSKSDKVRRLRDSKTQFKQLRSKLARFAADSLEALNSSQPSIPDTLNDRAQDNWAPLIAIADAAAGDWPTRARNAAIVLSSISLDSPSIGTELLTDIREIFTSQDTERLQTARLVDRLCLNAERPWATFNHGKPITQRQVVKILKTYDIKSKSLRNGSGPTDIIRGFELKQFLDAFESYLPARVEEVVTPLQTDKSDLPAAKVSDSAAEYQACDFSYESTAETECNVVTPICGTGGQVGTGGKVSSESEVTQ